MVEPAITKLINEYRAIKNSLLENLFEFFFYILEFHFNQFEKINPDLPDFKSENFKLAEDTIKKLWETNFQDENYFKLKVNLFKKYARKVIAPLPDQSNIDRWGRYFGKLFFAFMKVKFILMSDSSLITMKKEASSLYHIMTIFMQKIEEYFLKI